MPAGCPDPFSHTRDDQIPLRQRFERHGVCRGVSIVVDARRGNLRTFYSPVLHGGGNPAVIRPLMRCLVSIFQQPRGHFRRQHFFACDSRNRHCAGRGAASCFSYRGRLSRCAVIYVSPSCIRLQVIRWLCVHFFSPFTIFPTSQL